MLGTFPPSQKRWSMAFYYPNFQNDMWRIVGLCFFADKRYFIADDGRHYKEEELKSFLASQGIALYDTCTRIVRTRNTASDKDLLVEQATDIGALLDRLPQCCAIVTAGELATTLCCRQFGVKPPAVGQYATAYYHDRELRLYRMPSSSRAYPMKVERKAEFYRLVFDYISYNALLLK